MKYSIKSSRYDFRWHVRSSTQSPGELQMLAARPKMGKTALAMQIAAHVAQSQIGKAAPRLVAAGD
uniref:DnaB-like helicase C-terminal domain-containing protein n=1 Tax=Massilia sp. W12 TaxID=3126507 RepID=UPI00403FA6A6